MEGRGTGLKNGRRGTETAEWNELGCKITFMYRSTFGSNERVLMYKTKCTFNNLFERPPQYAPAPCKW